MTPANQCQNIYDNEAESTKSTVPIAKEASTIVDNLKTSLIILSNWNDLLCRKKYYFEKTVSST